ncbi:thiamine biosynthetic bifunctional enzyme Thi4 [Exidia glandulosa HHB12029]|uniref:Thiamine biosynthetic bifunctional enzyme Thi4 n=1 Tax=Exidia glandulosa HHB12029 TaxID=1314781 RepID=A0A165BF52_EXIGL|nr:thiamine biosynthetic bifunctional enzyme Thi4 [Exidia glandulosa HHB12029]
MRFDIDLRLYLVTGRELLPPGKSYEESLEEAIKGGVTVVQVREKKCDTGEFLDIAQRSKAICDRHNIPLIINDRVDVALAVGAHGVHLGQTDMPFAVARKLLPPNVIIGISVNTVEEALKACEDGADYLGIGAVYATSTKDLTKPILGPRGAARILTALESKSIKTVVIGGIKRTNVLRTLHGIRSSGPSLRGLDGVAVVSDIVASTTPFDASKQLYNLTSAALTSFSARSAPTPFSTEALLQRAVAAFALIRKHGPLVHQITNTVVQNQSANATLALGASPIMSANPREVEDLSKFPGALLVNIGTLAEEDTAGMIAAGFHANQHGKPVILDPVGVGATAHRRQTCDKLLNVWQATCIKGNPGEIGALYGSDEVLARGVDSVGAGFADPASIVKNLARREKCVVVMTGPTDWISDGFSVLRIDNGHPLLPNITGSGCMVGSAIACGCAAVSASAEQARDKDVEDGQLVRGDILAGIVAGLLAITIASEVAGGRADVKGTGTFLPALIDELANITPEIIAQKAKLNVLS